MGEKEVKSFVLHNCTLNVLDKLTDEQCGKLFRMIKAWQTKDMETFEELNADITLSIVFMPFETQFKIDREKYNETCEKRKESIKKRWKQIKEREKEYLAIQENSENTNEYKCIQMNTNEYNTIQKVQDYTKSTDNDNENVNDNDNDVNTTYGSDNSNIDNNNISLTHTNAHVRACEGVKVEVEKLEPYEGVALKKFDVEAYVAKEAGWCEVFCMNNQITLDVLKQRLKAFVAHVQNNGDTFKERKDFKHHFSSWCLIQKKQGNGRSKKFTATEERDKCIEERNSLQFARLVQLNEQAKKRKGNCTG